jgi:hydroxymethylpyrimidine/phosphomethylpyrimidine kinase
MTRPVALTIAGSDPSGGAGIQADLKTFHAHGVYGTAALTLLTVQNTQRVSRVEVLDPALVIEQIDAVVDDLDVGAAKTGALGSVEVVEAVAARAASLPFPLVVDPVMVSKHGAPLIAEAAQRALRDALLPVATLVTPNGPEAEALSGRPVTDAASALEAARAIRDLGVHAVLLKGGHLPGATAHDLLLVEGEVLAIDAPWVDTDQTHGTGCTLSAAIVARLARGAGLADAVRGAKAFLTEALRTAPGLGRGIGPVNHFAPTGAEEEDRP